MYSILGTSITSSLESSYSTSLSFIYNGGQAIAISADDTLGGDTLGDRLRLLGLDSIGESISYGGEIFFLVLTLVCSCSKYGLKTSTGEISQGSSNYSCLEKNSTASESRDNPMYIHAVLLITSVRTNWR